jgi:hypothetical protein
MDSMDLFWLSAFILIFLVLNLIQFLIANSLKDKPLGSQSIFDVAQQNTFFVMQCYGSFNCLMHSFASTRKIQSILLENNSLLTLACSLNTFGFTSLSINVVCLCTTRIVCLFNLTFIEETVGELKVQLISAFVTICSAFSVTFLLFINEETNSGSLVAMLTSKPSSSGKAVDKIYLCQCAPHM